MSSESVVCSLTNSCSGISKYVTLIILLILLLIVFMIKEKYNGRPIGLESFMNYFSGTTGSQDTREYNDYLLSNEYPRPDNYDTCEMYNPDNLEEPLYYYGPNTNALGYPSDSFDSDSNMYAQPLTYPMQLYPKTPWYPRINTACEPGECGATGTCVAGVCQANKTNKTVFDIPVN